MSKKTLEYDGENGNGYQPKPSPPIMPPKKLQPEHLTKREYFAFEIFKMLIARKYEHPTIVYPGRTLGQVAAAKADELFKALNEEKEG